jgi:hypothetical protein
MESLIEAVKSNPDYENVMKIIEIQKELFETKMKDYTDALLKSEQFYKSSIKDFNNQQTLLQDEINKLKIDYLTLKNDNLDIKNRLSELKQENIDIKNRLSELEKVKTITPETITSEMIELEKIRLDTIRSSNYTTELMILQTKPELLNKDIIRQTCNCKIESSKTYPYTAIFCSDGCCGKKIDVYVENKEYYKQKLTELCLSIEEEQVEHYEEFIKYIERGNFNEEHVVNLLEYEMEQKQKRHYEQLKTLYHNIPRLDIVYGSFETFIKCQTEKHGRDYKTFERKFMFEYEQLVAQPDLETKLRTLWRCSPRIQRKYNENIYIFLRDLNWGQLYQNYLPEYSEATHTHNIYYEKFLISLYVNTPELKQKYLTLDKFLIQGENNNKTYKQIYEENEHYMIKDEWYEKCLFLWNNVPRLQYNWNYIIIGYLTYLNLDFKRLYDNFYPEYKQLQINPKLREQIDDLWNTREDIRTKYNNDYYRWLWADYNWQNKVDHYSK